MLGGSAVSSGKGGLGSRRMLFSSEASIILFADVDGLRCISVVAAAAEGTVGSCLVQVAAALTAAVCPRIPLGVLHVLRPGL